MKFLIFFFFSFILNCNGQNFEKALGRALKLSHRPSSFQPESYSYQHNNNITEVIFAVAMGNFMPRYFRLFLGSLRKTGYNGDIVIAIDNDLTKDALNAAMIHKPVIYKVTPECSLPNESMWKGQKQCRVVGQRGPKVSVNMLRYFFYNWWATLYDKKTTILITDFTDVFFQSNPFQYMPELWKPPVSQLAIFYEALPQKFMHNCPYNSGWIEKCYGSAALESIQTEPISCSGTTLGSRDGIIIYTQFMIEQIDPITRARFGLNGKIQDSPGCVSVGMDQGFHNWLLHSGKLRKIMKVKTFYQGEGPVNTVGAFYPGWTSMFKLQLDQWGVLQGPEGEKYIANWNGDPSPVVHQADRYEQIYPDFLKNQIAFLKGLLPP